MEVIDPAEITAGNKLILPKLPRGRRISYLEDIRQRNARKMNIHPFTIGLVEAMGMVNILTRQNIETRNRAALILLDSNFEIALKEFIVNNQKLFPFSVFTDKHIKHIFAQRSSVIREVQAKVPKLTTTLLTKVNFYYGLRNKLIHERTTVPINDREISDYRKVIEQVLKMLFGLTFPQA